MTSEKKQEFTLRITQANKSELVVILYDMFQAYLEDAEQAEGEAFHKAISQARAVLNELIESLAMEYEIAKNLYQIYRYVERLLIQADVRQDKEPLKEVSGHMKQLRDAYDTISKEDTSPSVMENTEVVYAGMTYGKSDLNENNVGGASKRGFLA